MNAAGEVCVLWGRYLEKQQFIYLKLPILAGSADVRMGGSTTLCLPWSVLGTWVGGGGGSLGLPLVVLGPRC